MAITEERATERTPLERYARMLLIRQFENEIHRLFLKGEVHGTTHLYAGQEAVAVGVTLGARRGRLDRRHLPRARPLPGRRDRARRRWWRRCSGRATGVCGGRSGSMNVIDLAHGMVGCFGIVGGSIGAATGAALSAKRTGNVAVAFFGDGATNGGLLPRVPELRRGGEAARGVRVREQPVRRVHADAARHRRRRHRGPRARRTTCRARSSTATTCGRCAEATQAAVERARGGGGPTLLEMRTYRHYGHSKSDPATYRPEGELEAWLERDPLKLTRARLLGAASARRRSRPTEEAIGAELDRAVAAALAAPYPEPDVDAAREFAP